MLETQFVGLYSSPAGKQNVFQQAHPLHDSDCNSHSPSAKVEMSDNRSSPSPPLSRALSPANGHSVVRSSKSSAFSVESLLLKEDRHVVKQRSSPEPQPSDAKSVSQQQDQHVHSPSHQQFSGSQVSSGSAFGPLSRHPHSFYNYMSLIDSNPSLKSELEAAAVAAASYPDLSYSYSKYNHLHHQQSHHHQQQHAAPANPLCSLREWSESQARFNRTFGSLGSAAAAAAAAAAALSLPAAAVARSPSAGRSSIFPPASLFAFLPLRHRRPSNG